MLGLISERRRHGYEIIKEIEDRLAGSYSPSPGVVYPTLTLLEEGYRQRATDMRWISEDPAYDFLNDDPQYRSILKRVGEPPAQ